MSGYSQCTESLIGCYQVFIADTWDDLIPLEQIHYEKSGHLCHSFRLFENNPSEVGDQKILGSDIFVQGSLHDRFIYVKTEGLIPYTKPQLKVRDDRETTD